MPVVGPKSAQLLREFADHPEPPQPENHWIEAKLGELSIKAQKAKTVLDAKMMLQIYIPILAKHKKPDLAYAFAQIQENEKWFPDVSEILELAKYAHARRNVPKARAKIIILKHEREYVAPKQYMTADEFAAAKAELNMG